MSDALVPPPSDVMTEMGLLGAILMGGPIGLRALDLALEALQPESFYSEANRQTFAAIQAVREKGVTVDVLSVIASLKDRDRLQQVGTDHFEKLINTALRGTSFDAHVQRLAELHRLRSFIHEARTLVAQAHGAMQDVGGFLAHAEMRVREVTTRGEKKTGELVEVVVKRVLTSAAESMKAPGRIIGMPTGTEGFDRRTAGLRGKTLTILAGRPGMGKSAQALGWALHMARTTGKWIPFFSLEMSNDEQGTRTVASETSVPMGVLMTGNITPEVMGSLIAYPQSIRGVPLYFYEDVNLTVPMLGAKLRRLQAEAKAVGKDLGAAFVDYLQLMKASKRNQSREAEVAEVSRGLKVLAGEMNIPIVALAQLNREGEKGTKPERPQLKNLRESGSLEQEADIVVFIHREGYYDPRVHDDTAELIIAKGRNIAKGTVKVRFEGKHTRFGKLEIGRDEAEDQAGGP